MEAQRAVAHRVHVRTGGGDGGTLQSPGRRWGQMSATVDALGAQCTVSRNAIVRRVRSRLEEPSVRALARRGRADGVEADEYRVVLEEQFLERLRVH